MPHGLRAVARAGRRAQPSGPPPHATEQDIPRRGPSLFAESHASDTPPRDAARDPHAPAKWLLSPAGRISPQPPSRMERSGGPGTEEFGPGFNVSSRRVGVSNRQASASGHDSLDRGDPARGPGRGVGDPAKRETPRGPGTGRAAGSRSRESRSAASGGEQATRGRAPAWQDKTVTQCQRRNQAQTRGANQLHEVEKGVSPPKGGRKAPGA